MAFYKRNLPHYHPEGYSYFLTIRLFGTLPYKVHNKLKTEYRNNLKLISQINPEKMKFEKYSELRNNTFVKYEKILDSFKYGHKWLSNDLIASIVKEALHYRDDKYYKLIAYTIMPNHLHIVFTPIVERFAESLNQKSNFYIVTKIMQEFKKHTALESNKILNRKGSFWQHESYDHVVRNKIELIKIVNYIMNNPVKAGLCKKSDDWNWSYYNAKYLT